MICNSVETFVSHKHEKDKFALIFEIFQTLNYELLPGTSP